jgi:hypothetical protein
MEVFVIAVVLGLLPAAIAKRKGLSFALWWVYGAAVFIVALPHSLIMNSTSKNESRRS